jgi:hypothetical protein
MAGEFAVPGTPDFVQRPFTAASLVLYDGFRSPIDCHALGGRRLARHVRVGVCGSSCLHFARGKASTLTARRRWASRPSPREFAAVDRHRFVGFTVAPV